MLTYGINDLHFHRCLFVRRHSFHISTENVKKLHCKRNVPKLPFFHLSINHSSHPSLFFYSFFFFFLFRTPAVKTYRVKIMQLVSPVSQSRDIDARAPLDSKENIRKRLITECADKNKTFVGYLNHLQFIYHNWPSSAYHNGRQPKPIFDDWYPATVWNGV